jgi:hypothetical protein
MRVLATFACVFFAAVGLRAEPYIANGSIVTLNNSIKIGDKRDFPQFADRANLMMCRVRSKLSPGTVVPAGTRLTVTDSHFEYDSGVSGSTVIYANDLATMSRYIAPEAYVLAEIKLEFEKSPIKSIECLMAASPNTILKSKKWLSEDYYLAISAWRIEPLEPKLLTGEVFKNAIQIELP